MHYSDRQHPEFKDKQERWEYAWDHYTGEYAIGAKIGDYLHRKEQRETEKAYQERQDLSDPVLYFPEAVDSLNGIVSESEDAQRDWGDLAEYDEDGNLDPDSIAFKLKRNADGQGMNWNPLFKQVGIRQTVMHRLWGLVEGVKTVDDGDGSTIRTISEAKIKLINPQSVVNWWPTEGNPEQVLVKEEQDTRSSIQDTEGAHKEDVYVLYSLDGWTRFKQKKNESGEVIGEEVMSSGNYRYYGDTDRDRRILPIFYVDIPMPRDVGYLLARKQNYIFNQKSRRDFAIGNLSFALGILKAGKQQYEDFINDIAKGYNWLREDPEVSGTGHRFMSPDSSYLSTFGEILENDKKDFYDAAFKQYGDAAKQVTATQIALESKSGIEAFLSLLVTSIDEFENACLWRLEQVYFPEQPARWGNASVERNQDFKPKDIEEAMNKLSTVILNADRAGAMSKKTMIETLHPDWTDEQVEEELEQIMEEQGARPVPSNMIGG